MQMIKNLLSEKPDTKLKENLILFGQFIGNWRIHSTWFLSDNKQVEGEGEVSFGWILYGTAIQDVWTGKAINPPPNFPEVGFGTTIRVFNSKIDAWNCIWISPLSPVVATFIAKKKGKEIVLEGINERNQPENWIYSNITSNSFDWRAESSVDGGKTWILEQIIKAKRF